MKKLFLVLAISMLSISVASGATSSANSVVNRIPVDVCIQNGWICIHHEGDRFELLGLLNPRQNDIAVDPSSRRLASCGGWIGSQGQMKGRC